MMGFDSMRSAAGFSTPIVRPGMQQFHSLSQPTNADKDDDQNKEVHMSEAIDVLLTNIHGHCNHNCVIHSVPHLNNSVLCWNEGFVKNVTQIPLHTFRLRGQ